MFDFPNSPAVGTLITGPNGSTYRWDGAKWVVAGPPPSTVTSWNSRTGAVTITGGDVALGLGYTAYNAANPAGYVVEAPTDAQTYARRGSDKSWQVVPPLVLPSGTLPLMNGVAAIGALTTYARADHVHPVTSGIPLVITSAGQASVTGVTTETNLAALRIPAGTIGANGVVEVKTLWNYTNNANNKFLFVRYNQTSGATAGGVTSGTVTVTTTANTQMFNIIRNNNAANAQICYTGGGTAPFGSGASANFAIAVDTTADSYLNINGTLANAGDTITLVHAYAVVFPHA